MTTAHQLLQEATPEHMFSDGALILTPGSINQMGITELSENLGVKVDFAANPAHLRDSLIERNTLAAGSLISFVRDYNESLITTSGSGEHEQLTEVQTEADTTPIEPVEDSIITTDDVEPNAEVSAKPVEDETYSELNESSSSTGKDAVGTDDLDVEKTPEQFSIEVPQELEDFFQSSFIDYIKQYAVENGTVMGVFGTPEEPNERFAQVSIELKKLLKNAATDESGNVDAEKMQLLVRVYNTRISMAYQEAEAAAKADSVKATDPIAASGPAPAGEKPQTEQSDSQPTTESSNVVTDEIFEQLVSSELSLLFDTYEQAVKEGTVEQSAEGIATVVLSEVRKFAKENKTSRTKAVDAYDGSAFQVAVNKLLTLGYAKKYENVKDIDEKKKFFRQDIETQHRAINGELNRVDKAGRVKRGIGRVASAVGKG